MQLNAILNKTLIKMKADPNNKNNDPTKGGSFADVASTCDPALLLLLSAMWNCLCSTMALKIYFLLICMYITWGVEFLCPTCQTRTYMAADE